MVYIRIIKNALGFELAYQSKATSFVDVKNNFDELLNNRLGVLPKEIIDQKMTILSSVNLGKIVTYTAAEGVMCLG